MLFVLELLAFAPDVLPEVAPDVAGVEPGCTMAPPLAPNAPPVVAPAPVGGASADVLLPPLVDAPVLPVVLLPLVVWAIAPPATRDATRRPRSLLMNDLLRREAPLHGWLGASRQHGLPTTSSGWDVGTHPGAGSPT